MKLLDFAVLLLSMGEEMKLFKLIDDDDDGETESCKYFAVSLQRE